MAFKGGNIVTGLAIGVGAAVIGPILAPMLKPQAKSAIKAGLAAYDQARVSLAEFGERTSDIAAEARAEMDNERKSGQDEPGSEAAA
jgi:hypothetical protein